MENSGADKTQYSLGRDFLLYELGDLTCNVRETILLSHFFLIINLNGVRKENKNFDIPFRFNKSQIKVKRVKYKVKFKI